MRAPSFVLRSQVYCICVPVTRGAGSGKEGVQGRYPAGVWGVPKIFLLSYAG